MPKLTIELTSIPPILEDQDFACYLVIGSLYTKRLISSEEAFQLSGDEPSIFEQRMAQYGFPMIPDDLEDSVLADLGT